MVTEKEQIKKYQQDLGKAVRFLKKQFGSPPDLAIVFGSGLGEVFIKKSPSKKSIPYSKVPRFGKVSVSGHRGNLHFIPSNGKARNSCMVLEGRQHYYEGVSPQDIVFPYRALALWGVKKILLTNASGSLRKEIRPGELVWIKDHINLMGVNPLRGPNLDYLGPRFPSLTRIYQNTLSKKVRNIAKAKKIKLNGGVYVAIPGPSYETEAEVKAFQKLGGDLIGMSTVLGSIASAHAGMEVAGLSAVTNSAIQTKYIPRHEDVLRQAGQVDQKLSKILEELLKSKL